MQTSTSRFWLATLVMLMTTSLLFMACDKQPIRPTEPDPVLPGSYMPIREFRAFYNGSDITIPAGTKKIRGVVISNSANEASGNVRIQDESGAGIYIFTANGSPVYTLGSVLEIDAAGAGVLTVFNGDLELKNVPAAKVAVLSGGITATPRVATVQ
ncbi:MAG: hypothetical protein JWP88_275, partial [Flaviaesturariibacter sp.]|nr:hypothetical protein [Flaviaesturariibacter sp.]